MPNIFYTYMYLREDGTPYYVGKGTRHRAFYQKHRGGVIAIPPKERVLLEPHASEEDALEAEKFLIAYYGRKDLRTGRLLNMTDGGENPPLWPKGKLRGPISEKHRKKLSIAAKKQRQTESGRKNMSVTGKLGAIARWRDHMKKEG
jgi:hypothetical protein